MNESGSSWVNWGRSSSPSEFATHRIKSLYGVDCDPFMLVSRVAKLCEELQIPENVLFAAMQFYSCDGDWEYRFCLKQIQERLSLIASSKRRRYYEERRGVNWIGFPNSNNCLAFIVDEGECWVSTTHLLNLGCGFFNSSELSDAKAQGQLRLLLEECMNEMTDAILLGGGKLP